MGNGVGEAVGEGLGDTVGDGLADGLGDTVGDVVGLGDVVGEVVGDVVGDGLDDGLRLAVGGAVGVAPPLGVATPGTPPTVLVGEATTLLPGEGCGSGVVEPEDEQAVTHTQAINARAPKPAVSLAPSHAQAVVPCTFIQTSWVRLAGCRPSVS